MGRLECFAADSSITYTHRNYTKPDNRPEPESCKNQGPKTILHLEIGCGPGIFRSGFRAFSVMPRICSPLLQSTESVSNESHDTRARGFDGEYDDNHGRDDRGFRTCSEGLRKGFWSWLSNKSSLSSLYLSGLRKVDFEVDDDVNSEVLLHSADMEIRKVDEDGMVGCSVEAMFENNHDIKIDQDESERGLFPLNGTHTVNNSVIVEEPYVGQEFDSEAAAHAFYNAYATQVGFVIRVSKLSRSRRDGSAIGRALVCNKEGFRTPDKREKIIRQRAETRVGCRAMVLVRKVSSGKWTITKFVKEHTHPLTPGKGRKDLIYDQYPNEHYKIRELSQQLAIEKRRSATYKRHLEMIFEHIEEHNQSLSKKIQNIVNNVTEIESKRN